MHTTKPYTSHYRLQVLNHELLLRTIKLKINDHDAAIIAFITKCDDSCNFIVSVGSTYTERLVQHFKVNDDR